MQPLEYVQATKVRSAAHGVTQVHPRHASVVRHLVQLDQLLEHDLVVLRDGDVKQQVSLPQERVSLLLCLYVSGYDIALELDDETRLVAHEARRVSKQRRVAEYLHGRLCSVVHGTRSSPVTAAGGDGEVASRRWLVEEMSPSSV